MEEQDEEQLYGVGDEEAVPDEMRCYETHSPEYGDDHQREDERYEQCHAMVAIEFIYRHQRIDVAPEDKAQGKNAEGVCRLADSDIIVGTEESCYGFGEHPNDDTCDEHADGDEPERLAEHQAKGSVVAASHLDGAERLYGTFHTCQKEVVYLQQVHANGKGE